MPAFTPTHAVAQRLGAKQNDNPIYIADSPIAEETLIRIQDLINQNNANEAVRQIDHVIHTLGDLLIESKTPGIYITVRERYEQYLVDQPEILEAYRSAFEPIAETWIQDHRWEQVHQRFSLTQSGCVASLRIAQVYIERGHLFAGLRVLNSLLDHPDSQTHAHRAYELSKLAAQVINNKTAWDLSSAWAQKANISVDQNSPFVKPVHETIQPSTSVQWNTNPPAIRPDVDLQGLVPGSLGLADLTPEPDIDQLDSNAVARSSGANWIPTSWVSPMLAGDDVYTHDGITLSCFDRFTLRPKWRVQTTNDLSELPLTSFDRNRVGRAVEDFTSITFHNNDLYLPTGLPRNGSRVGESRIIKVDAHTGDTQWSIDVRTFDDSLAQSSIRGQLIADGNTLIAVARTNDRRQRLIKLAIIGIDIESGEPLWIRQIGSAGSLPFQQMGQLAHNPILYKGVVYGSDHIGLAYAIETATGHVLWARGLPAPDLYDRHTRPSFAGNSPVTHDQSVFYLTTDGSEIYQIDQRTGETISKRTVDSNGGGFYLLQTQDHIACVGESMISLYPLHQFNNGAPRRSPTLGGQRPIRGRVLSFENTLLVPIETGIEVVSATSPSQTSHIPLDSTGNMVADNGQVVIADQSTLTSYLAWDIASTILRDRVEFDPAAIITLAELAYRAKKSVELSLIVQEAFDTTQTAPFEQRSNLSAQLFDVIHFMIEPHSGEDRDWLADDDQRVLFKMLSSLAMTHERTLAHRMAWGQWNEQRGEFQTAIRAYQDILDQPRTSASMWKGAGLTVRGDLEANRRIGDLLQSQGYQAYQQMNQLAIAEHNYVLTDNQSSVSAEELEQLAKKYAWSEITPNLWLNASIEWNTSNQTSASIQAAKNGIERVIAMYDVGIHLSQSTVDSLASQVITGLMQINNIQGAQAVASRLVDRFPNLTIRMNGSEIDHGEIIAHSRFADRLPKLGQRIILDQQPNLILGTPIQATHRIDPGGVIMYTPQLGTLRYDRAGRGLFETVWTRQSPTNEFPLIPWQSESQTIILWPAGSDTVDTGTIEAIETTTGKSLWKYEDIASSLSQDIDRKTDNIARVDGQFDTPTLGPVRLNQLITLTDGHTIIISDRVGRAIAIDLHSGQQLWSKSLPANRVHDLDIAGGILAVCGLHITDTTNSQDGAIRSVAASIDPRTGNVIQSIERFGQQPRWIRATPSGNLVCATLERILAINTKAGGIDWVINEEYLRETQNAWVTNDRMVVLSNEAEPFMITLEQGSYSSVPLETRSRIRNRGWISAKSLHAPESSSSVIVTSSGGYLLYNRSGELTGVDPVDSSRTINDIAVSNQSIALLQQAYSNQKNSVTSLYLTDLNSTLLDQVDITLPIGVDRQPNSLTAVNGGLIVGYNEVSVFIRIPADAQ